MHNPPLLILISLFVLAAVYLLVRYGWVPAQAFHTRQLAMYDRVLRQRLLMDIEPNTVFWLWIAGVITAFAVGVLISGGVILSLGAAALALWFPPVIFKHLEQKRRQRLEVQLVDGLTTLASATRAGLTLTQSMELLVQNHKGPIRQEMAQILKEYQLGMDLSEALRRAAARIGSPLYRLTFTAIEMHRTRGGDAAQSMDRIAESIREIQRLEGKLDAITAQGRSQANMMATMPLVMLGILYLIVPGQITMLFTEPIGRIILLVVGVLIFVGQWWIKKIMQVDL